MPGTAIDHKTIHNIGDLPDLLPISREGFQPWNYEKVVPAGRMGTPEEMAEAILYLASDDSRYMLGAEIILDGGKKAL